LPLFAIILDFGFGLMFFITECQFSQFRQYESSEDYNWKTKLLLQTFSVNISFKPLLSSNFWFLVFTHLRKSKLKT
jgi:hypothetical protein